MRDALRLLERDGLVELVPNRGAIVPELRAVDVLEVYALRASLGTLALHKLMLDSESLRWPPLERELRAAAARAVSEGGARDAADADLAYQAAIVAAAGLPRVAGEFDRLTWQVRMFLGALEISYEDELAAPARRGGGAARGDRRPRRRRGRGAVAGEVRALGPRPRRAAPRAVRRAALDRSRRLAGRAFAVPVDLAADDQVVVLVGAVVVVAAAAEDAFVRVPAGKQPSRRRRRRRPGSSRPAGR